VIKDWSRKSANPVERKLLEILELVRDQILSGQVDFEKIRKAIDEAERTI